MSAIPPDTKDWTWVLTRPCPQCGVDAGTLAPEHLPDVLRGNAEAWLEVLAREDVAARRDPGTWSPLEYACHVRDVHRVFDERLERMLTEDDPAFENWDQDAAAEDGHYTDAVPREVGNELLEAAERVAQRFTDVTGDQWARTGRRSNGSVFTVTTLGQYQAHDVLHHLWDVQD
ncbi:MAG TPA: DinB family protein [Actinomycetales bacterium]|nr:DinB family protein [Actinomycetales bacterium]